MKFRVFFAMATFAVCSVTAFGAWISVNSPIADQVPQVSVSSAAANAWRMNIAIPGLSLETYSSNGQSYDRLSLPDEMNSDDETELPFLSRVVALRSVGDPSLEVVSEEWTELEGTYELEYASGETDDAYFPDVSYEVTPRQVMGGVPLAVVHVNAAKYNPVQKKVRVLTSAEFIVHENGPAVTDNLQITETTASIMRAIVPNWDEASMNVETVRGTMLFIVANNTTVVTAIQDLVKWRTRKGYTVEVAGPNQIGSPLTTVNVKNYIQNRYNGAKPRLEFVCLLGDADSPMLVPTYTIDGGVGDWSYSRLDGNDLLPDVAIGRLCFDSIDQLAVILSKILSYECDPPPPSGGSHSNWYKAGGLFAGSGSGISPVHTMRWIHERMLDVGYNNSDIDTIYYIHESVTDDKITASINAGASVWCYRGYYHMEDYDESDIANLTNGRRLPFMTTITCATNNFDQDAGLEDVCELLLKAGTTSNPKGVIGAVGTSSIQTHTRFNNCLVAGLIQGLLREGIHSMGGSVSRSKLELYRNYPDDSSLVADFCNYESLIGDPAVDVFTDTPETLYVNNPASMSVGSNTLNLTVTNQHGQPVQGAYVNLIKGTEITEGNWTDANGQVIFNFKTTTAESLFVTATKHNCRPAQNFTLVTASTVFVSPASSVFVIDDDNYGESHGDRSGTVNPGETIELAIPLKNWGSSTAYGVSAVLSLTDPFLTGISNNYQVYGDIGAGATMPPPDDFVFSVANYVPDGHILQFTLTVSDASNTWISAAPITVSNANLDYLTYSLTGVGNGILDPGESGQLGLRCSNTGTRSISMNIIGYLRSSNSAVVITDSTGSFTAAIPGGLCDNYADPFQVTATSRAFCGERIPFTCIFPLVNGFQDTVRFSLNIGAIASNTPTPPDSYGYWAYDNTDLGYPKRPVSADTGWVEIDPHYGGSGVSTGIVDDHDEGDMSVVVNLPFTFKYYGQNYNQIAVCSNGWLAMGADQVVFTDFRNHTIPSAAGPSAMIAPFWDDLWVVEGSSFSGGSGDKDSESVDNQTPLGRHLDDCTPDFQISLDQSGYTSPVRTTCGAGDDCNTRPQEDHIYQVNVLQNGSYTFTLCNSPGGPQAWDSYMYLDAQCCATDHIARNDDGCGSGGLSTFTVTLSPGIYYLLIEGYYPGNCGEYQLDISCSQPPVFTKHDAVNHRFIVEWSRVMKYNGGTNPTETFECILYEPGYPATPTGDGEILFQYLTCTNTYDVYSSNDYATVGIENRTQTDGVRYSYWNIAGPGAAPMVSGRSILFTTAKFFYSSPQAPTNLTAIRSGNDLQLRWNGVHLDTLNDPITVDGYKIYRDVTPYFTPSTGNFITSVSDTTYLDANAVAGTKYFYIIQAYASGSVVSRPEKGNTSIP